MDINIGKTGQSVPVDVDAFTPAVMEYVVRYGLTQILNDAHSQITRDSEPDDAKRVEAVMALVNKKLDALMSGDVRMASTRTGDPVKAEAVRMATQIVKNALRAAGKKLSNFDAKQIRAAADKYLEKHPEIMDKARAAVAELKELDSDVEI